MNQNGSGLQSNSRTKPFWLTAWASVALLTTGLFIVSIPGYLSGFVFTAPVDAPAGFVSALYSTSVLASMMSTAALFTPLRHRVQGAIDRRFYRRKYDAQRVLTRFAIAARDEVELDKLTGALLNVVQDTMQPASVGLWLKQTNERSRQIEGK